MLSIITSASGPICYILVPDVILFPGYQALIIENFILANCTDLRLEYVRIHCLFLYCKHLSKRVYIVCSLFVCFPFLLTQCPPGMKQQVLGFYTKLLGRIKQPLLPHINVHRPVQVCVPRTQSDLVWLLWV